MRPRAGRSSFCYEAVGIAVQSILAHKLRSLLTLTGIIIGVASVVVRRRCPSCEEVGAQVNTRLDLRRGPEEMLGVQIAGVTANMDRVEDKTIEDGRFLLPHEVDHAVPVCVLGTDVRDRLFPATDAIGRTLRVAGVELRVVGIEARRGSMFGQSLDNHAYLPITTSGAIRAASGVPMVITLAYVALALVVSSLVGILAGIYPASRAAKLDPVVALTRS